MVEAMRFTDGEAYEAMMGIWSALIGAPFLDWLDVPDGERWADIGCGNGASTEMIVRRAKPASVEGIDPSQAQLDFARNRHLSELANFTLGSAMHLPYRDASVDAGIMALVIFFVPDPAKGVEELRRIVRPGGMVAAYAWDMEGGGFPYEDVHVAMRAIGAEPILPPHAKVARLEALHDLWTGTGLIEVETDAIVAHRVFADFDDYWAMAVSAPGIGQVLSKLGDQQLHQIRDAVHGACGSGELVVEGRAHAVKGRVPA